MKRTLAFIGVLIIFASCRESFVGPNIPDTTVKGMGTLQISFNGEERTLLPSTFDASKLFFVLIFTEQQSGTIQTRNLDKQNSVTVQLPMGIWNLTAQGFISESDSSNPSEVYASGTVTGINVSSGSSSSVYVNLTPVAGKLSQNDQGTLSYYIDIPQSATGTIAVFNQEETDRIEYISFTATENNTGEITLDSGFYYVIVTARFDGKVKVWRELACIYDYAITEAFQNFSESDFETTADAVITQFGFSIANEFVSINSVTGTIGVFVPPQTDISALAPVINFTGFMVNPAPDIIQDFSDPAGNPVYYTVYALNGAQTTYRIIVSSVFECTDDLIDFLNFFASNTELDPIPVKIDIDLTGAVCPKCSSTHTLSDILSAIYTANKYVNLDISGSTGMAVFDSGLSSVGKNRIVSLVLPDDSTSLITGTSSSYAFSYFSVLRSVRGENITSAGNYAFYNRSLLESADFPSIVTIEDNVFSGCTVLSSFVIPNSLTSIGSTAFNGCKDITITIQTENINVWTPIFTGATGLNVIFDNGVSGIEASAFANCPGLTDVTIMGTVASVDLFAFTGSKGLKSIDVDSSNAVFSSIDGVLYDKTVSAVILCPEGKTGTVNLPAGLSDIGPYAFSGCTALNGVNMPASVTDIGNNAFSGCTGINSIAIPEYVTNIGNAAFSGYSSLTVNIFTDIVKTWSPVFTGSTGLTAIFESGVTDIGDFAFEDCAALTGVTLPSSISGIGESAFQNCTALADVDIPLSVTSIGDSAFSGCSGLGSANIPQFVTSAGTDVFSGCVDLAVTVSTDTIRNWTPVFGSLTGLSVIFEDTVSGIDPSAFLGCTGLVNVSIPTSVNSIGASAFSGCTALADVTLPYQIGSISDLTFSGCTSLTSVYIMNGITGIGVSAFQNCTSLNNINLPNSVNSISASAFSGCAALKFITMPASIRNLGNNIFSGCTIIEVTIQTNYIISWAPVFTNITNLTVVLENTVSIIDSNSYENCTSLIKITLSDSVNRIGAYAFSGCTKLTTVNIPGSVSTIGGSAFYGCTALTSLTISQGVNTISANSFTNCGSLASVIIPASVNFIGANAFNGCNKLARVTINGYIQNFTTNSPPAPFPGDLRVKYVGDNGGPGIYTASILGEYALWIKL